MMCLNQKQMRCGLRLKIWSQLHFFSVVTNKQGLHLIASLFGSPPPRSISAALGRKKKFMPCVRERNTEAGKQRAEDGGGAEEEVRSSRGKFTTLNAFARRSEGGSCGGRERNIIPCRIFEQWLSVTWVSAGFTGSVFVFLLGISGQANP